MKKIYFILFTFLNLYTVSAQIGFEENIIISDIDITKTPSRVVSADIDGDGDLDVISAAAGKINWYENSNGFGRFLFPRIVSLAVTDSGIYYANSVQVADIDGDGDMDIISATNNKIAWYENTNGTGDFGPQQIIVNSGGIWNFSKIGDLDNDGDIDVLASSSSSSASNGGGVRWFENTDGLGSFSLKQIVTTDGGSDIELADLDNDGDQDIILGGFEFNNQDYVVTFNNLDGLGTFGTRVLISNSGSSSGSYISAGDVDNDGDIDLVLTKASSDIVSIAENTDGLGTLVIQYPVIDGNLESAGPVKLIDLDGDGDLDIHVAADDNDVSWYENTDGLGNFSAEISIILNRSGIGIPHLFDIDNDNDIDFMYYARSQNKIAWRENNDGLGNFSEEQIISSNIHDANDTSTADIDGDGDKDILTTYIDGIGWFENQDGQGNFIGQRVISSRLAGATSVFPADLDGDGDTDVLSASPNGIAWHENNNGQGDFNVEQFISSNFQGKSVFASDIDMDGDMDIIYTTVYDSNQNTKIAWVENMDGNGNFGSEQDISAELIIGNALFVADLDGDGDNDVLTGSQSDNKIAWYENTNGNGAFGPQQTLTTNLGQVHKVIAADMDNDNDLDIICAAGNSVSWFKNTTGQGDFTLQQTHSGGNNTNDIYSVFATDLDNDGDNDLVVGTDFEYRVFWLQNTNGLGLLDGEQLVSDDFNSNTRVFVDDINGDNKKDIISVSGDFYISTSLNYNKLIWFGNEGIVTNTINGFVNYGETSNGCTSESLTVPNILIETTNGTESIGTLSLSNGFYNLFPDTGNYTTSIVSQLPDYYTVTPASFQSNFSSIGNVYTTNFCIEPNQVINDLNISIIPITPEARPGFDVSYKLVYSNAGTTNLNGNVTFEFDNAKLNFLNASEVISSQTIDQLNFDFVNLSPFESRTIDLNFNIFSPPTVNIGEVLNFTATINPISGDYTEADNLFNFNQTLIGSYDPNDITVLEGDQILLEDVDNYLHYVIRFQNTGTASAIRVKVDNILDSKLNWNTLQIQNTSHNMEVEIKNGNEVSYIFNGIYLPDSTTDEPNSHGFIAFKIKPKANVQLGDVFSSVADIYFDFNPPIITNTALTEIIDALSIEEFNTTSDFTLFPNPVDDKLTITSKEFINAITVYSVSGQVLKKINLSTNSSTTKQMDISFLSAGIYFVKVKTDKGIGISKIIKN